MFEIENGVGVFCFLTDVMFSSLSLFSTASWIILFFINRLMELSEGI